MFFSSANQTANQSTTTTPNPSKLGFVITRHVNSLETNQYWKECCRCIRLLYSDAVILIVDDNSNRTYIDPVNEAEVLKLTTNCHVIQSEFPGSGEILGYYYFYRTRWFDKAIIMHDSVFIQKRLDVDSVTDVRFLWHFDNHDWDTDAQIMDLMKNAKMPEHIVSIYTQKHRWYGCFGVQSIITRDFLSILIDKYNLWAFIPFINNRSDRMCMERIFSVLCACETDSVYTVPSFFGIISEDLPWGLPFNYYLTGQFRDKTAVKCWTGR